MALFQLLERAMPIARSTTPPVASLQDARKRYGDVWALDGVNVEVKSGEVLVMLGPNGAGKTTAISALIGLRQLDSGSVQLFGENPSSARARQHLGVTPQNLDFPGLLHVDEVIDLVRVHYRNPVATNDILEAFELTQLRARYTSALSIGERRRLAVAIAFVGNPRLVCLDEPTTGLDVESRRAVWRALQSYVAAGGTVLLTTHYLEEAEALATRVIIIDRGKTTYEGSVSEIKAIVGLKRVRLRTASLPPLNSGKIIDRDGDRYVISSDNTDALLQELIQARAVFSDFEIESVSLEQAFLTLTEHAS